MTPLQQLMLGVGASKKTYVDEVFSTFLYTGNGNAGASQSINNGINLSGEGGLVWFKTREAGDEHELIDTVRGRTKRLRSDTDEAQATISASGQDLTSFNNNGFSLGAAGSSKVNWPSEDLASWTFRKAPGFFDVVTYTGNGTNRVISHDLGCEVGMMIIKKTSGSDPWYVWHRGLSDNTKVLKLNSSDDEVGGQAIFNSTAPTATQFSLGTSGHSNENNYEYIAYLFAGGESTAATARSVDFDGTGDYLSLASSADFNMGSGDFTLEGWVKWDTVSGVRVVLNGRGLNSSGGPVIYSNGASLVFGGGPSITASNVLNKGQWYHVAGTKSGSTSRLFLNGNLVGTSTTSYSYSADTPFVIGNSHASEYFDGKVSNARVVKGTAVYTSSFRPPTEPLTSITNTVLLCCNNSSTTGKTTGGTITANGDPTASTDSPFDDPAGFVFGDAGDQNVIKCGSYTTDSNEDATVNLGWEPQFVLVKRSDSSTGGDWLIYDSMRGFLGTAGESGGGSLSLSPNNSNSENNNNRLKITSTGFYADDYGANRSFIYLAIRRNDGYVSRPAEDPTSVFAMDTGSGSSTIPTYDSGFTVDWALRRSPASTSDWISYQRLLGLKYVVTNSTSAEATSDKAVWDSNVGFFKTDDSSKQAWMFKRHAGFDVVCYEGTQTVQDIRHSMNKAPEMMWIKNRDSGVYNWSVFHSGLGDNRFKLYLNTTQDYSNDQAAWNNTAPTSTHFTLGTDATANKSGDSFIAMLFASVDGISKVGYYTGNGGTQTITTGFQPRFIIIKRTDTNGAWYVIDTVRGWGTGGTEDDKYLELNTTTAQADYNFGQPESNGFSFNTSAVSNNNNGKYIYYAHA